MLTPVTVKARTLGTAVVVTLPKTFRDQLGIRPGRQLTWRLIERGVLGLTKAEKTPVAAKPVAKAVKKGGRRTILRPTVRA